MASSPELCATPASFLAVPEIGRLNVWVCLCELQSLWKNTPSRGGDLPRRGY